MNLSMELVTSFTEAFFRSCVAAEDALAALLAISPEAVVVSTAALVAVAVAMRPFTGIISFYVGREISQQFHTTAVAH